MEVLRVLYRGYEQAVILVGIMDLWLLGVLRVLHRGYEQAVIWVGIMDLNVHWAYLGVLRVLYRGYEQAVILVRIMDLWLLGVRRVLHRVMSRQQFEWESWIWMWIVTIGSSKSVMEPPTMLLVPICRDMQLWWDKPPIPSPRNCMPGETSFDDVGRNCACVTWTQMYVTLQTKNVFHSKAVIILFLISLFVNFFRLLISI